VRIKIKALRAFMRVRLRRTKTVQKKEAGAMPVVPASLYPGQTAAPLHRRLFVIPAKAIQTCPAFADFSSSVY
jgi:hypothetical protein